MGVVRTSRFRFRAAAALGLTLLAGIGQAAETRVPGERIDVRLSVARFRLEPVAGTPGGNCAALRPEDLIVKHRGRRIDPSEIVSLERHRGPALHALLIDTSRSMAGRLELAREAASGYVMGLDPERDRAMVLTFDDDVLLRLGATSDRDALLNTVERIRVGQLTSLRDGVFEAVRELAAHEQRPVLLLVTDGVDSASVVDQTLLDRYLATLPELTVFAIGVALPAIRAGRSGPVTPKKWLGQLAGRTRGHFFDVPTARGLERAFGRVREMLDNEWELAVRDEADAPGPGRFRVRLRDRTCRVEGLGTIAPPDGAPRPPRGEGIALPPSEVWEEAARRAGLEVDSGVIRLEGEVAQGMALDLTLEPGPLYSVDSVGRQWNNGWPEVAMRRFEIVLPPPDRLPTAPADLAERLAEAIAPRVGLPARIGDRQRPVHRHARPFHDLPFLWHGRTWLDHRSALAATIHRIPAYAEQARVRLEAEAEQERIRLASQWQSRFPAMPEQRLVEALAASARGRELAERSRRPMPADLVRHLAGWLGDLPASELLRAWELDRAERLLRDRLDAADRARFVAGHGDLRRLFWTPSYARVLTPLIPGRDPVTGVIGFWRITLPRPGWMLLRVQGRSRHPEYGRIPLDLIPEQPYGFQWLVERLDARDPWLDEMRSQDWGLLDLRYDSLVKPRRRDPERAWQRTGVQLTFGPNDPRKSTRIRLKLEIVDEPGSSRRTKVGVERLDPGTPAPLRALFEALASGLDVPVTAHGQIRN